MEKKDLCQRCGKCCRSKRQIEDHWIAEDTYCPHFERLADGMGNCKIYDAHENRLIKFEGNYMTICLTARTLARARLLPDHCPYAKEIPGYQSLVINYEDPETRNGGNRCVA